jgi:hypothetical protein
VQTGEQRGSAAGLVTCSSIWACPVCSVHIRVARALEIAEGLKRHGENGGGALFITATLRHCGFQPYKDAPISFPEQGPVRGCRRCGRPEQDHRLSTLLDVLLDSWRAVQQGRGWRSAREALGVVGTIRAVEVTYGANGWHPHVHLLVLLDHEPTHGERDSLLVTLETAWLYQTGKRGHGGLRGIAVDVKRVTDGDDSAALLAGYVTKGESLHHELARGDRKGVRSRTSWNAWEILQAAADGEVWAVRVWHDYEDGTRGRRAIEWSRGLRDRLGLAVEKSDEELTAEATEHGELVAVVSARDWRDVAAAALDYAILQAAVQDGAAGVDAIIKRARIAAMQRRASRLARSPRRSSCTRSRASSRRALAPACAGRT